MNLIENRRIGFDYEILETFEAGIELRGFEVKALRKKQGSLEGAYAIVRGGECYLVNATIPPYQITNTPEDYDPRRPRRLLLTWEEISRLAGESSRLRLTIAPISVYNKGRKIKVEIATVRGKKKYDKRELIKKRDTNREIWRTLKK